MKNNKVHFIFFIIIIITSITSYANNDEIIGKFSCQKIKYVYINGILNMSIEDSRASAIDIKDTLGLNYVETIYNQSEGAFTDLMRAMFQKIEESNNLKTSNIFSMSKSGMTLVFLRKTLKFIINSADFRRDDWVKIILTDNQQNINQEIKKIKEGNEKLIIFSHSQGNFYANQACREMGNGEFENIQIATPTDSVLCGNKNHYTTIHDDEMVQIVRKLGAPIGLLLQIPVNPPLKSNVPQLNSNYKINNPNIPIPTNLDELSSVYKMIETHDFQIHSLDNYLTNSPSFNKIKSDLNFLIENNYSNKQILKTEKTLITCENVEDFINTKIPAGQTSSIVLGKTIKFDNKLMVNNDFYIEKTEKSGEYLIRHFKLTSWVSKYFSWVLYLFAPFGFFLALPLLGAIAQSLKNSEKNNK